MGRPSGSYGSYKPRTKPNKTVTCPHCSKEGGPGAMSHYHFDKCKYKHLTNNE